MMRAAGGSGAIGAGIAREAPADGHTLLMASATFVIHPLLYHEVATILQTADMQKRMANDGSAVVGNTPAEFAAHIRAESVRWAEVIHKASIRPD